MKDSKVMVLSNLKKSKLRGIESEGMILCASNQDHTVIEVVRPHEKACVGAKVQVGKYMLQENAENELMNPKSKTYPKIMQGLQCDSNGYAIYNGVGGSDFWIVGGEKCKPKSLKSCSIS
eukprot:NODE_179_length_15798_cov_0.379769.p9 type:complete len:120 gc:universal NODE_179_length_15798_cov_0.379769:3814-3455(-)